jgi:hypothetical protein
MPQGPRTSSCSIAVSDDARRRWSTIASSDDDGRPARLDLASPFLTMRSTTAI